ncbi:hypothetical protein HPG69_004885, partial [Diceros bicornis minor]
GAIKLKTENHEPDDPARDTLTSDLITRKINQIPEAEMDPLEHGSTYNSVLLPEKGASELTGREFIMSL